jgi:hypothetical protein
VRLDEVLVAARELVTGLVQQPWGQVSPSIYETARVVTLAPWLAGHSRRVDFLVSGQRTDGAWGPPDAYALIPTLSATEAILTTARRAADGTEPGTGYRNLPEAAAEGLRWLREWLGGGRGLFIPDIPMVELIVPALVSSINRHLDQLDTPSLAGPDFWRGGGRLHLPPYIEDRRLIGIQARLAAGSGVPEKLLHALEIVGDVAGSAPGVHPVTPGTVGASPAATVAWLGTRGAPEPGNPARQFLEAVVGRTGGPVPCPLPITTFERAWVLRELLHAGLRLTVPPQVVSSLETALGPTGAATGPGLPTDADTTAVTLYALSQLGVAREPDSLWAYRTGTHFRTWQDGENGLSMSVNAHVLETFGEYVRSHPRPGSRYLVALRELSKWLCDQQRRDGSWQDRWHASPYYATACCAVALCRFGHGPAALAVGRATEWVLSTQHADGSWGIWGGTAEETAYAIQILLSTDSTPDDRTTRAAARGYEHLLRVIDQPDDPPLWHDKDLYRPVAIVRAAVLSALYLSHRRQGVIALAARP